MKRDRSDDDDDDSDGFEEDVTSGSDYEPDTDSDPEPDPESVRPNRQKKNHNANANKKRKPAKIVCNYGADCYRKNPDHFREYSHPHLEKILAEYTGDGTFDIPNSLEFQRSIIEQQLTMLKSLCIYPLGVSNNVTVLKRTTPADNPLSVPRANASSVFDQIAQQPSTSQVSDNSTNRKPEFDEKKNGNKNENCKKKKIEDFFSVVASKGKMYEKHQKAAPFYMFFTTITAAKETHEHPLSITFQEILDHSLGSLQSSLQINFLVDIGWLLAQYYFAGYSNKPLTILYGDDTPDIKDINKKRSNVEAYLVPMKNVFGKHHTKMSILCYDDNAIRVVISTANLYIDDWENRTQGLWISPKCPLLANPIDIISGDSPTGFKRSLINYLNSYSMSCLSPYIEKVKHADFSQINVFFVGSVPGSHFDSQWGLLRISNLLSKHCVIPEQESDKWEFIAQASSIGSYGADPKLWLCGEFRSNFCNSTKNLSIFSNNKQPKLKFIYPSLSNVKNSHDNLLGGGCLPYSRSIHEKQTWLNTFLQKWSAVHSGRSKAMPHIKSYLRTSPDASKCAYFLLTSANVSKSAWGVINKGNKALRVNSYEVGVLFLPKFVINKDYFSIELSDPQRLPIPYDIPPIPYDQDDIPWVMDYLT